MVATPRELDCRLPAVPMKQTSRVFLVGSALLWAAYSLLVNRFWWVCDDAFISFRYARNWALGRGLRYNLGVEPPVEGYSNFLWTAWCALAERLDLPPEFAAPLLSYLCGSLLLWRLTRFLRHRLGLSAATTLIGVASFALSPAVLIWSTSGLETIPYALLVFALFEGLDGEWPVWSAVVLAVGVVLMRSEGAAWVLATLVVVAVAADPARRRQLALIGGLFLAAFGLYTAWRISTFGHWLPNAAAAKVSLSLPLLARGVRYVVANALVLVVPVAVVAVVPWARRPLARRFLPILCLAALPLGFSLAVGGDFMPMGRFLVVGLPFFSLLLAAALDQLARRSWGFPVAAALLVGIGMGAAWNVHLVPRSLRQRLTFRRASYPYLSERDMLQLERDQVPVFTQVGRALAAATRPGDRIVFGIIGAVGYVSDRFLYDTFGLVTPEVGRRRETGARLVMPGHDREVSPYFFADRQPDVLVVVITIRGPAVADESARLAAELASRGLTERYAPDLVPLDDEGRFLLLARRIPSTVAPEVAWARFRGALLALEPGA